MKTAETDSNKQRSSVSRKKHRLSAVWAVPIVALVVSSWVLYDAYKGKGPEVVIAFQSGEGLQVGKSKVKYLQTIIGEVTDISISESYDEVLVTVELVPSVKRIIAEDSRFWVVRPQIRVDKISGLGTLLSGPYIAAMPGTQGKAGLRRFKGLERPPLQAEHPGGIQITLSTDNLKSVERGAPVIYRGLKVGAISSYTLADDYKSFLIEAYIYKEYRGLLAENMVFWHASGFEVDVGKGGVHASMDSLAGLLSGGIHADFLGGGEHGTMITEEGHLFKLHDTSDDVEQVRRRKNALTIVLESKMGGSLKIGESIYYRKLEVGEIESVTLSEDATTIIVKAYIPAKYRHLVTDTTHFWNASGVDVHLGLSGVKVSTESLATFLVGGIAMGHPEEPGKPVVDGQRFILYPEAEKHWRKSKPAVPKD